MPDNGQNCQTGWVPYGYACYKLYTTKARWTDARTSCNRDSGELVSIHSETENSFVYYLSGLKKAEDTLWIGLNDKQVLKTMFKCCL